MKKDEARSWKLDLLKAALALIAWAIALCVFAQAADGAPAELDGGTRVLVTIGAVTVGSWMMRVIDLLDRPARRKP